MSEMFHAVTVDEQDILFNEWSEGFDEAYETKFAYRAGFREGQLRLAVAIRIVRVAQKRYFAMVREAESPDNLVRAKALERKIDRYLAVILGETLF